MRQLFRCCFFSMCRSNILIKFTLVPMFVMKAVSVYGVDPGTSLFLRFSSCRTQHGYSCMEKETKIPADKAKHSSCCSFDCGTFLLKAMHICSIFWFTHLVSWTLSSFSCSRILAPIILRQFLSTNIDLFLIRGLCKSILQPSVGGDPIWNCTNTQICY